MLPSDTLLDEATLKLVLQSGFSRFLVHAPGDVQRIEGLVLCKVRCVDPCESTPYLQPFTELC